MSFTKLATRIDGLPLILAGPMVRRVDIDTNTATVWLALHLPRRVRLEIYDPANPTTLVLSGTADTRAVGARLHIVAVSADQPSSFRFSPGATYKYNIIFSPHPSETLPPHAVGTDDGRVGDLFAPHILAAPAINAHMLITYDGGLPGFVVPPSSLDELRILHTSCRRINGSGVDAFPAIEYILEDHVKRGNGRRPTMLFLTGDQVYQDGSDADVLEVLTDAATTLMGWDEVMPGPDQATPAALSKAISEMSGMRTQHSLDDAGLTNPRRWHCFGLGEFIGLYLLTFSDVLWPQDLDYDCHFRGGLAATRRIFANVATYMIFDDHEVSNSWNLTHDWCTSVLSRPMGRRVLQNALSAYALCQGWGNDPAKFSAGPGLAFLNALVDWSKARGPLQAPEIPRIQAAVGMRTTTAVDFEPDLAEFRNHRELSYFHVAGQALDWHYTVPCPEVQIDVLDMYTWRSFPSEFGLADHVPKMALDRQLASPVRTGAKCLLVVVSNVAIMRPPGPRRRDLADLTLELLDHTALTYALAVVLFPLVVLTYAATALFYFRGGSAPSIAALLRAGRSLYVDEKGANFEWQSPAFERLLSHLAVRAPELNGGRRVVILSGDVHKSYVMQLRYRARRLFDIDNVGAPARTSEVTTIFNQLIAGSSKYATTSAYQYPDANPRHFAGWLGEGSPGSGDVTWSNRKPWVARYNPSGDEQRFNGEADWRYTIEPMKPKALPTVSTSNPTYFNTLPGILEKLSAYDSNALQSVRHSDVINVNNIGDVEFNWSQQKIVQRVWFWLRNDRISPFRWLVSEYEVGMEPGTAAPPPVPLVSNS
jgi:hypothetical protein